MNKVLKCPHCGGNLDVREDLDIFYCQYCGTKIQIEKLSKNEMRLHEMEHEERMKDKENESDKWDSITLIVFVGFIVLMILGSFYLIGNR